MRSPFVHKTIRIYYDATGSERVLVTGFKGFGLVGYITTYYLAEKLGCEKRGVVVTRVMPEAVTVDDDTRLVEPFEIYSCSEGFVVIVNHDVPAERERTYFAEAIILWAKSTGVREAVFVGGFDSQFRRGDEKLRWLSVAGYDKKLEEPTMSKGLYIVGPLALLALFAELHKLPALVLLPYTNAAIPDPRAAAVAVEKLNSLYGVNVDTRELLEEAEKIEKMVSYLEEQKRRVQQQPTSVGPFV